MNLDPGILTAIGSTLLAVGGGAVAAIKFLFSRLEASVNQRIDAMIRHIAKLETHVEECEKDRARINKDHIRMHQEFIGLRLRQTNLKDQVDQIAPPGAA